MNIKIILTNISKISPNVNQMSMNITDNQNSKKK